MGRELQKRKRRSSRPTVTQPLRRKKVLNPMGNSIIAKNWNKKETLTQNYRRLGLVAKLGTTAGGIDKLAVPKAQSSTSTSASTSASISTSTKSSAAAPFTIKPSAAPPSSRGIVTEARIERDADGNVVRVVHTGPRTTNPLNDPLNQFDDNDHPTPLRLRQETKKREEEEENRPEVVRLLEREASRPTEARRRQQSAGEVAWLERLAARHGADTAAMARDARLNPMQQTRKDIERRLRRAGLLQG